MPGPKWDVEHVACLNCGQMALVFDGSVKWRSGTRPPRSLAHKDGIGSSPRADFEIAHYFHCTNCLSLFCDQVDIDEPRLSFEKLEKVKADKKIEQPANVEKVDADEESEKSQAKQVSQQNPPRSETGWIPGSVGDVSARIGYDVRDLIMEGYSQEEIDEVLYGRRTLEELLSSGPERRKK